MVGDFVCEVVTSPEHWNRPGSFSADCDLGCGVWRLGLSVSVVRGVVVPSDVCRRRVRSLWWDGGDRCGVEVLGAGASVSSLVNDARRGWWYRCALVAGSVYDGDTFSVRVDHGFGVVSDVVRVRLFGVNAPELTGVSRRRGLAVRDFVRGWFDERGPALSLQSVSRDKYGRLVGRVFSASGESLGDTLLRERLATKMVVRS